MKLSNNPPKGTADWMPEEFLVRKYIFDTWRKVCLAFGYEEYLTPIVELADVYRAKSGEDVGGKELMSFFDRGDRELAIRPEMTPSVTRMVSRFYNEVSKPIRLFSIANFMRNEKPQKGRNREFWQLNFDVFGSESVNADIEILQMAIEIMKAFNATSDQFVVRINDRDSIRDILGTYFQKVLTDIDFMQLIRLIDKYKKLEKSDFYNQLKELNIEIYEDEKQSFEKLMENDQDEMERILNGVLEGSDLKRIKAQLDKLGYTHFIEISPGLMRGLDYYDGMVFEVFDKNPDNARSLFGGGRYNGLAGIFGSQSFPAVGCAPGDETTRIFLESWGLIPTNLKADLVYIPMLGENIEFVINKVASKLRAEGKNVEIGLEVQKLGKALQYADKKGIKEVVIMGAEEIVGGNYKIKNMVTGEEVVEII